MNSQAEVLPPREERLSVHLGGLEELVDADGDLRLEGVGGAVAGERHAELGMAHEVRDALHVNHLLELRSRLNC